MQYQFLLNNKMGETYNIGVGLIVLSIFLIVIGIIIIISLYTRPTIQMMDENLTIDDFSIFIISLDRKPERYQYVSKQLDTLRITGYQKWPAVDGFDTEKDVLISYGIDPKISEIPGVAGCAASHIRLWRHIVENKINWAFILEDDAHFHPRFLDLFPKYWKNVPKNAKIIFPGYCANVKKSKKLVLAKAVMCSHAYMVSHQGAQYLLNNLLPMDEAVDVKIVEHFKYLKVPTCYVFNGDSIIDGIRPNDYKERNGNRCKFDGIIYQNQEDQNSTIRDGETLYTSQDI